MDKDACANSRGRRAVAAAILAIALAPFSGAEAGKRYAVLIGVGDYKDGSITTLASPRNDAAALASALSGAGWDLVLAMTDDKDIRDKARLFPDRDNIEYRLSLLADQASPADTVLVFFSGHGVRSASGDALLLPFDANRERLESSSISLSWIQSLFQAKGIGNALFAVDACRENLSRAKGLAVVGVGARPGASSSYPVLYSTSEGSFSYEAEGGEPRLSLFTKYLVEGLRSGAGGGDAGLSWGQLAAYVSDGVRDYAIKHAINQKPELVGADSAACGTIVALKRPGAVVSVPSAAVSGIGVQLASVAEGALIAGVFPRAPADMADLKAGDVIVAVDGASIAGLGTERITSLIRGETGSQVRLSVRRQVDGRIAEISLARSPLVPDTMILQEASGSLPQVVASIFPLAFFESGDPIEEGAAIGSYFEAAKARYVYWLFKLSFAPPGADGSLPLVASWRGPDGKAWRQEAMLAYKKDGAVASVYMGWGNKKAGNLAPGEYAVDILYKGKRVASGTFVVRK